MTSLVFSHPALLWGLLATSLPLIIHLINRHRARRHPFAAIDFLLRVKRRTARRLLLRHILLLVARTLLIAALVVAAAGPSLQAQRTAASRGPTGTALVIDTSFSMRTRTAADAPATSTWHQTALERARALVRGMPTGDCACVLAAGPAVRVLTETCTDSRAALLDALDEAAVTWGTSDLSAAMERAATVLATSPGGARRVVLLTDGAAHAFPAPPSWPAGAAPPEVVLENVADEDARDNHAVDEVRQTTGGRTLEISARFVSYSSGQLQNLPVEVRLGDDVQTRGFTDLAPGGSAWKTFNLPVPTAGPRRGQVELTPDQLAEDDRRMFYVSGRPNVQALLINGDMRPVLHRDELFYLEHALAPAGEGVSGIGFTTITPERFRPEMIEEMDVVFLANVRELSAPAAAALRHFVASGGGLFVSLGDKVDVDRINTALDDLLPWPLRDIVALGDPDPDGVHRQGVAFTDLQLDHPVLSIFDGDGVQALQAVRTWRAAVVEPGRAGSQARVLLRYTNGSPALAEGTHQRGRVMLYTSSLDRDWTSWPARASFLPFLQRATSYLAGRLEQVPPLELHVGDSARIPVAPEADAVRITHPDGQTVQLGIEDLRAGVAVFHDTHEPGWYQVRQTAGGQPLPAGTVPGLVVHVPRSESDLRPVDPQHLQHLVGEDARLTLAGHGNGRSRSRTWVFLLLALLLVLCEAVLIRK